jgi:uncharacterized membrane protein
MLVRLDPSLAKTLSFAAVHFTVAFTLGWLLTGSPVIGGVLALVEPALNTVAFYVHEKLWSRRRGAAAQRLASASAA